MCAIKGSPPGVRTGEMYVNVDECVEREFRY